MPGTDPRLHLYAITGVAVADQPVALQLLWLLACGMLAAYLPCRAARAGMPEQITGAKR